MVGKLNENFRRHLLTLETLAELGPELTAERPFEQTAGTLVSMMMDSVGACEGALFTFHDKPAMLTSLAARGFANFPSRAVVPLLPRQVHALAAIRKPQVMSGRSSDNFLSSNGNIAPEMFRCIAPLRVASRFVGLVGLGARQGGAGYAEEDTETLNLFAPYVALSVHNHSLVQTLESRISENLKLLASIHAFHDHTLQAFAAAIDVKDFHTRGHSLRVGRYSAGIAESLGLAAGDVAAIRAAGYLHDIGKVAVDKYIFSKPAALEPREFQEMADHTVVGHQIVSGVEFPWQNIPDVVRSHHERSDGSGYPDHLTNEELSTPVKIMAIADTFDAMVSERPYRQPMTAGEAASMIVRYAPEKYDADVVQGFLVQLRREAVRSAAGGPVLWTGKYGDQVDNRPPFLEEGVVCNISPADIDNLAAVLNHKVTRGRTYFA